MTPPIEDLVYCSDLSQQAGELLYGTAAHTQAYLLLEHSGAWGEKAVDESEIPEQVKARLKELAKQIRGLKTLLIKTQRQQRQASGFRFFAAALSSLSPRLYAFMLADYTELLALDIPAMLSGETAYAAHLWHTPLYLVCANGRRDPCCARHGLPVYHALSAAVESSAEAQVWQCTHVGGHRFAANVICLPHGVLYGRVRADNALAILDADRSGRIYLPNLRGRVCHPPVAQAAEYFLRQRRGEFDLHAIHLLEVQEISAGEWAVRFETHPAGEYLDVQVRVAEANESIFESCALDKSSALVQYNFQTAER